MNDLDVSLSGDKDMWRIKTDSGFKMGKGQITTLQNTP